MLLEATGDANIFTMSQEITRWLIDLGDKEERIRTRAVKDIVRSKRVDLGHILKRVASKDKAPGVRYLARKGLDLLTVKQIRGKSKKKTYKSKDIIENINSEDPNIRNIMALEAINFSDTRLIPYLNQRLRVEDDNFVIATIVKAMGILGGKKEIETIAPYLNHDDSRVRANAIEGLEMISKKGFSGEIIPMLFPQIKDPDHRVRVNALKAMIGSGRVDISAMLSDLLDAPELWTRDSAIYAIISINDKKIIPLLEKALKDPAKHIRDKAQEALKNLQNNHQDLRHPASAQGIQGKEDLSEKNDAPDEKKDVVSPAALSKNLGIYQLITQLVNENPNQRKKAVISLGKSADPRAVEHIKNSLDDDSPVIRYFAKKALAQLEMTTKGIFQCPNCGFLISKEEGEL